jgi:hypothetical protein
MTKKIKIKKSDFFPEKMDRFGPHHKIALWSQTLVFFKPAY